MKINGVLFIILIALSLSCTNTSDNSEVSNQDISLVPLAERVLGKKEKVFRGFDFSTKLTDIKNAEKLEILEEHPQGIIYTFDTKELETVDIYYVADSTLKIKSIKTDVYLNEEADNQILFESFKGYYNSKYQIKSESENDIYWNDTNNTFEIELKKVNKNRDIGIALIFNKLEN